MNLTTVMDLVHEEVREQILDPLDTTNTVVAPIAHACVETGRIEPTTELDEFSIGLALESRECGEVVAQALALLETTRRALDTSEIQAVDQRDVIERGVNRAEERLTRCVVGHIANRRAGTMQPRVAPHRVVGESPQQPDSTHLVTSLPTRRQTTNSQPGDKPAMKGQQPAAQSPALLKDIVRPLSGRCTGI